MSNFHVRGSICVHDDDNTTSSSVEFVINSDLSYRQWGQPDRVLGRTQPIIEALVEGVRTSEIFIEEGLESDDRIGTNHTQQ